MKDGDFPVRKLWIYQRVSPKIRSVHHHSSMVAEGQDFDNLVRPFRVNLHLQIMANANGRANPANCPANSCRKGLGVPWTRELLQVPTFLYKFQQSTVLISSIDLYILSNIFFFGGISDQNWRSEIQRDDDSYQRIYPCNHRDSCSAQEGGMSSQLVQNHKEM